MTLKSHHELVEAARKEGSEAGRAAASWYFNRTDPTDDDYKRVLKGLEDGDPEIMDTLTSGWLSGEFADSPTPQSLYRELGMTDEQIEVMGRYGLLDEISEAYEQAADQRQQDEIEQYCKYMLERDIVFTIDVTVPLHEHSPDKLLEELCDLLAQRNCSLNEDKWEES